jgi:hypothetical protein
MNKKLIIIASGVALGIGLFLVLRGKGNNTGGDNGKNGQRDPEADPTKDTDITTIGSKTTPKSDYFPLKLGNVGIWVIKLQIYMNYLYNAGLKVDGKLGQKTFNTLCSHHVENPRCWIGYSASFDVSFFNKIYYKVKDTNYDTKFKKYVQVNWNEINSAMKYYGYSWTKWAWNK